MTKPAFPRIDGGRPLTGLRIVVTRAAHQATEQANMLFEQGAVPILYPCIKIVPPEDTGEIDGALRDAAAGRYDWLLLTSTNTVIVLAERAGALGLDLTGIQAAAVGPATAEAAREMLRIDISLVAEKYEAESLAASLGTVANSWILLPQSAIARPVLAQKLREAGAGVTAIAAYRTVLGQGGEDVPAMLAHGRIDAVCFTSASTVKNFLKRLENEGGRTNDLSGVCLAAIGPITAEAMKQHKLAVDVMPDEYILPALVVALVDYFSAIGGNSADAGNSAKTGSDG